MVDDEELAVKAHALHVQLHQLAALQLFLDHAAGQDGDAQPLDRGVDERHGARRFPDGVCGKAGHARGAVEDFARTAAVFPEQKALLFEYLHAERLAGGESVVPGADRRQAIHHVGPRDQHRRVGDALDKGDVEIVGEYPALELVGGSDQHFDVRLRRAALKGLDAGGQKQGADGDARADAEDAGRVPAVHLLLHVVKAGADALGVFEQAHAGFGQLQAAAHAVEEDGAVVLLQLLDGEADGGLGHVLRLRGPGRVAAVAAHFEKDAHVSQCHGGLLVIRKLL